MVMSNVYKNTKVKYVNIDTKFRDEYNYNDTVNYTLTLNNYIPFGDGYHEDFYMI